MNRIRLLFIMCVATLSSFAQQQDTLVNKNLIDHTTELVSKTLDKVTFTHDKYSFSLYPMLGFGPQTGFQVGIMPVFRFIPKDTLKANEFYRPTTLIPSFMVSAQGQFSFEVDFLMYTKSRWILMSNIKINETPNDFYGIGNNDSSVVPTDYTYYNRMWSGEVSKGVTEEFFIGFRFLISHTKNELDLDSEPDAVPLDESVYGFDGGYAMGIGPVVRYDTRDDILFPRDGFFGTSYYLNFPKASFNDYSFQKWVVDLRYYKSLKDPNRVLAFQVFADLNFGEVPFYLMSKLGGKKALRGIEHPFRYIDEKVWFTRAEYRRMFKNRFGYAVFAGLGNEFGSNDNRAFKDIKVVYGAGLRFKILPEDNLNFRADVGFGPHGQNSIYLTVLEAF
ncbi:outer membrane protein assembly factor [Halosquirtibacter xylanolyticus]|uniref:BamA/TamA family outer membrane protein n=1 Tax=Halosquirtibacter xylanolyticus TaxID=3374599 RepID=UPI0037483DF6|nr:outer membrane protein assembly factor [Prolixibacteraceae bacterium]